MSLYVCQARRRAAPAVRVVLGAAVLDADNREARGQVGEVVDHALRLEAEVLLLERVAALAGAPELARGHVEGERNLAAGVSPASLMAASTASSAAWFEPSRGAKPPSSPTATVRPCSSGASSGAGTPGAPARASANDGAPCSTALIPRSPAVVGVGAAVNNVSEGDGQVAGAPAGRSSGQRQAQRGGGGARGRERRESSACARASTLGRAVERRGGRRGHADRGRRARAAPRRSGRARGRWPA